MSMNLDKAIREFKEEGFKDGDLISHDWLHYALDVDSAEAAKEPFLILERVESFKNELLTTHHIALQSIRGKGYRIVPAAEQARFAAEQAAHYISKGLIKSQALLENTRREDLTTAELKRHTDTEVRMSALSGMIAKGRRDVFEIFKPAKRIA